MPKKHKMKRYVHKGKGPCEDIGRRWPLAGLTGRGHRRNHFIQDLDLGLLASITVQK